VNTNDFRNQLLEARVLVDAGSPGLYHRSADYESVVRALEFYARAAGRGDNPQRLFVAPVINLETLKGSGYVNSFPNLIGTIDSFDGDTKKLGEFRGRVDSGGAWFELMSHYGRRALVRPRATACIQCTKGPRCRVRGSTSRCSPTVSATNRAWIPLDCSRFDCTSSCTWATPDGALAFRERWDREGAAAFRGARSRPRSWSPPTIRSLVAARS
jgi:hypothetical protein